MDTLHQLKPSEKSTANIATIADACSQAMNDDFNSPVAIAHLFDAVRIINAVYDGKEQLTSESIDLLKTVFASYVSDIFGLAEGTDARHHREADTIDGLMDIMLDIRQQARAQKNWAASDNIRQALEKIRIRVKDGKEGASWEFM
jgi:cysteinyl-tRNA synthetase